MEQALRYNEGKPQWSMVDFEALILLVRVLEFGAQKYDRDNWKKGLPNDKTLESLARHLFALMAGETHDKESGLPHIGHIMCNAMFYSHFNKE